MSDRFDPAEIDSHEDALEVVLMWGDEVLHVEHLSPPRAYSIEESIGVDRIPITVGTEAGVAVVVPGGQPILPGPDQTVRVEHGELTAVVTRMASSEANSLAMAASCLNGSPCWHNHAAW